MRNYRKWNKTSYKRRNLDQLQILRQKKERKKERKWRHEALIGQDLEQDLSWKITEATCYSRESLDQRIFFFFFFKTLCIYWRSMIEKESGKKGKEKKKKKNGVERKARRSGIERRRIGEFRAKEEESVALAKGRRMERGGREGGRETSVKRGNW